jgi:superfamily I DNA/RNA helicase
MGQVMGLPVDYHYYDSTRRQREALSETLRRLLADGVNAADIIVLSRLRLANSGVAGVDGGDSFCLVEVGEYVPIGSRLPVVRFATVQAFKGMESPVVVLCDVEQVSEDEPQALLYVAMSRARSQLTVLVHVKAQPLIAKCIHRKLQEGWNRPP